MKVGLLTVHSHDGCTLKDVAGGYGTVFRVGESLRARLLERAKSRLAELPPLVLGRLAARLRDGGHEVRVATIRRTAGAHDALPRGLDAAIVLTSMVDADAERTVLAELSARGTHAIAVGAYASAAPETFADVSTAVVRGEPESLDAASLLDARGVTDAGFAPDLDALPLPDWAPFPRERYRYALLSRGTTLPVESARGCAYGCGYCPWRVTAPFRERAPERVVSEVRFLRDTWGSRGIAFRDPLMNLDEARVRTLAKGLRPLGVRFSAEMRADRLDDALVAELARSGLRSLELGVESADTSMLSREKRQPPEPAQIEAVVRAAHRHGVRVIANFMLGLPDDTEEKIRETVALAKKLDTFAVQFTIATPYPGTTLATRVEHLIRDRRPDAHTGFTSTFPHAHVAPAQLEALREWAYTSYHFRPKWALRFLGQALPALLEA